MIPADDCPSRHVIKLFGSRWKIEVLWFLRDGAKRYGDLAELIHEVSPKMLTQSLRQLERDGLVERTQYSEIPPRVEYELTPLAESVNPLIDQLVQWWENNRAPVIAARDLYDAKHKD